jgi:hypothetical protein
VTVIVPAALAIAVVEARFVLLTEIPAVALQLEKEHPGSGVAEMAKGVASVTQGLPVPGIELPQLVGPRTIVICHWRTKLTLFKFPPANCVNVFPPVCVHASTAETATEPSVTGAA